jgi:hypothetical protein
MDSRANHDTDYAGYSSIQYYAANLSGSVVTLSLTGPEKEVLVVLSFSDNDMVVAVSVVIPTSTGVIAEPLWRITGDHVKLQ